MVDDLNAPDDAAQVLVRLERIQTLIDQLAKAQVDFAEQQAIAHRLRLEIAAIRARIHPFRTHPPE